MKKIFISLILLVMVIGLTGCGNKELKDKVKNQNLLSSKVKIGDYVSYNAGSDNSYISTADKTGFEREQTFKTTGNERWRVLSVDDGIVSLISENTIKTSTNSPYQIEGGKAYLNVVDELNAISGIYSKGKYATSGRNMTYDDVIKIIGYDYLANKYQVDLSDKNEQEKVFLLKKTLANKNESSSAMNFGNEFTITNGKNKYVPSNDNEQGYVLNSENIVLTDSYIPVTRIYDYIIKDEDKLSLIFGNNDDNFWLATSYIQKGGAKNVESTNYAYYGIYYATPGSTSSNDYTNSAINPYTLMKSDLSSMAGLYNSQGIRPVVSLDKNTPAIKGTGTEKDPYTLS